MAMDEGAPWFAFQVPEKAGRMRVVSAAFLRTCIAKATPCRSGSSTNATTSRLLDWGVDGIISDRPDIAVATRDEWLAHEPTTSTMTIDRTNPA